MSIVITKVITGSVHTGLLHQAILDDVGITTTLEFINNQSGSTNYDLCFASSISGAEDTALDALIAAHDATPPEMARAIKKVADTHGIFRYIRGIEQSAFPTGSWEINPDVSGVTDVPERFWKYDGTNILVEMSQGEKDAVDASLTESEH